jgi:predicted Zn-dependent protease with MMP-like domain
MSYKMIPSQRARFDKEVQRILDRLPKQITWLLEEIPLHVEDYPSQRLMREMNIKDNEVLCGYFHGVSIDKIYEMSPQIPNTITLFRKGIYALAVDEQGHFSRTELRRQIRITILHELAHYLGISEEEIKEIGYG